MPHKPIYWLASLLLLGGTFLSAQETVVPADLSVGDPLTTIGDGLYGEYWKREPVSILTDGADNRENGIDRQIEGFGPPSGTFNATLLNYTGNDLTEVETWLGEDSGSFTGTASNLDDGALRFSGYLNVPEAGTLSIGTTSDDGSRINIGGLDIVNNDGSHGDATVDADVNFEAAGIYPIEITYFNGDWTSDNSPDGDPAGVNHSGNPDPSVHGGANFHLRMAGADITPEQVEMHLFSVPGPNFVPANRAVSAPLAETGDGLKGEYWKRDPVSILTDGADNRENGIDRQIQGFGDPTGTFTAKVFSYTGNDLTEVTTWLGDDAASFMGTPDNLDDGAFRFSGFINVAEPGTLNIGTTSDDGSRVKIGGIDLVNNDGSHGDATVDTDVDFEAAGLYPIEITYFNGDWTSDNSPDGDPAGVNHSGNPDPSVHGGANFHLRLGGEIITPEGVEMLFTTAGAQPLPKQIAWVSFHPADDTPAADALAAGFAEAPDVGYTDLLEANGYEVTRFVSMDDADLSSLESADLVIISRSVASGHYQQDGETAAWNGLNKPVIIMGGYILRSSRLGFTTGSTIPDTAGTVSLLVNEPSHPIFDGIPLDAGNVMVNPYAHLVDFMGTVQRGISVNTDPLADEGEVLAVVTTADDPAQGGMIIGEWQGGATLSTGDVLGGHRLVFLSGSREASGLTSQGAGIYDLDSDGEQMFLNAVEYMLTEQAEGIELSAINNGDGTITIDWTGGTGPFLVQTAIAVTGPWFDLVTTDQRTTTQPMVTPMAFFRVQDQTTQTVTQFVAMLSGQQENPPVDTPASGVGIVSLEGNSVSYLVSYQGLTADASAAHFHGPAAEGANAGVLLGIHENALTPLGASGLFGAFGVDVDAAFVDALNAGMTYLNIHNSNNTGGEIRGQVLPASDNN